MLAQCKVIAGDLFVASQPEGPVASTCRDPSEHLQRQDTEESVVNYRKKRVNVHEVFMAGDVVVYCCGHSFLPFSPGVRVVCE